MTIDITINGFVFLFAMVFLASTLLGLVVVGVRWFYYRRLAVQMELRALTAKAISKQVDSMKARHEFTKPQKDFLNSSLDVAHDRKIVWLFSLSFSQIEEELKDTREISPSLMSEKLKVKDDSELALDIGILMCLCLLHASTYSFFLGFRFRRKFLEILGSAHASKKTAKINAEEPIKSVYARRSEAGARSKFRSFTDKILDNQERTDRGLQAA